GQTATWLPADESPTNVIVPPTIGAFERFCLMQQAHLKTQAAVLLPSQAFRAWKRRTQQTRLPLICRLNEDNVLLRWRLLVFMSSLSSKGEVCLPNWTTARPTGSIISPPWWTADGQVQVQQSLECCSPWEGPGAEQWPLPPAPWNNSVGKGSAAGDLLHTSVASINRAPRPPVPRHRVTVRLQTNALHTPSSWTHFLTGTPELNGSRLVDPISLVVFRFTF
ncbi:hypothetical protein GOODEAATRI_025438, partial [Goodea atripinnis]